MCAISYKDYVFFINKHRKIHAPLVPIIDEIPRGVLLVKLKT